MHCAADHTNPSVQYLLQVDVVPQGGRELLGNTCMVVLRAVEPTVDRVLNSSAKWVEPGGNRQRRRCNGEGILYLQSVGNPYGSGSEDQPQDQDDDRIGEGLGDDSVDLVEPISRHGKTDRHRRSRPEGLQKCF